MITEFVEIKIMRSWLFWSWITEIAICKIMRSWSFLYFLDQKKKIIEIKFPRSMDHEMDYEFSWPYFLYLFWENETYFVSVSCCSSHETSTGVHQKPSIQKWWKSLSLNCRACVKKKTCIACSIITVKDVTSWCMSKRYIYIFSKSL